MNKLRRALTELLLEVTNEELALIAKEVHLSCKGKSIRIPINIEFNSFFSF
jgi:hypothetical protein